ncbi:MAG: hypothetical protein HY436_00020, partial [Candidatus Liptonbacteria bacterium]|nr:hypothetical protein [Candidatus Liptonbacteria bacterium]
MNPRNFFSNLLQFLRARAPIGGLEVSDAGLRFAHFANKRLYLFAERLAPGTLERGAVRDRDRLLEALVALRRRILGRRARRRAPLNVVVSLSSVPIYSQVFSIPRVKGENMQKAIELNLRMASPADPSENYAGRQVVFEDRNALRVDILAAFVNRATADQLYEC